MTQKNETGYCDSRYDNMYNDKRFLVNFAFSCIGSKRLETLPLQTFQMTTVQTGRCSFLILFLQCVCSVGYDQYVAFENFEIMLALTVNCRRVVQLNNFYFISFYFIVKDWCFRCFSFKYFIKDDIQRLAWISWKQDWSKWEG